MHEFVGSSCKVQLLDEGFDVQFDNEHEEAPPHYVTAMLGAQAARVMDVIARLVAEA